MGAYDTVRFDGPLECPNCGKGIESLQTEKFGKVLEAYGLEDRVDHTEETRATIGGKR